MAKELEIPDIYFRNNELMLPIRNVAEAFIKISGFVCLSLPLHLLHY